MKSPQEFRIDVYEKQGRALAARKRRRKYALLCLPLAVITAAAGIFAGPRLFSRRGNAPTGSIPLALQVGKPAQVPDRSRMMHYVDLQEEREREREGGASPSPAPSSPAESQPTINLEETAAQLKLDPAFQSALNTFAEKSTALLAEDLPENGCYCPLSLYYALALAASGSSGDTALEFLNVLNASDPDWLAEQCGKFYRQRYRDNVLSQFSLANSLWMDGRCSFQEDFLAGAQENFFASLFQADFSHPEELGAEMSQWVSENTGGLLSPNFQLSSENTLAILNTVHLEEEWSNEFHQKYNTQGEFTKADGSTVPAEYMHKESIGSVLFGNGFTRTSLRLMETGSVIFILPDPGVSPQDLLTDPEAFQEMFFPKAWEEMTNCSVHWSVPKFSFDTQLDLGDALRSLGLKNAFSPWSADFSGMCEDQIWLSQVEQGVHVGMDEKGISAAAYTALLFAGASAPEREVNMDLNRPFLFAIVSNDDLAEEGEYSVDGGSILFVGVCGNPAA